MSDGPPLAADLAQALQDLRDSVNDAESAFQAGHLRRATRDDVVELALVRGMGLLEEFLGDLFLLGLQGKLGGEVIPTHPVSGPDEAALLVVGADGSPDVRYISWLPFKERTIKRAERLLEHAEPFGRLRYRSSEREALADLTIVRNRVAHDSESARSKFEELARRRGYPSGRAADYLVSTRGGSSEVLLGLAAIESISAGLADPTEAGSRGRLTTEDPFDAQSLAPPGSYECRRGRHGTATASYSALGECVACPAPSVCPTCGRRENAKTLWERLP